ncbi:response regulator [Woodsholea maritima]|uniref:response regulator n=1 Tax=Woodsholea maritima TaxID=240237 RepID=UPI00036595A5|nr:response regulator [Woodsholea maritima]
MKSVREIVEGFSETAQAQVRHLASLARFEAEEGDHSIAFQRLAEEAHRLAGAAGCLGFEYFSARAEMIEELAQSALALADQSQGASPELLQALERLTHMAEEIRPEDSKLLAVEQATQRARSENTRYLDEPDLHLLQNKVVLVVDDDVSVRNLVRVVMLELGAKTVHMAKSGKEGFEIVKRAMPDLVICDWMMDQGTGLQLLKVMRHDDREASAHIPFILLTKVNKTAGIEHAIRAGVDDFVVKPFNRRRLVGSIKKVLDSVKLHDV